MSESTLVKAKELLAKDEKDLEYKEGILEHAKKTVETAKKLVVDDRKNVFKLEKRFLPGKNPDDLDCLKHPGSEFTAEPIDNHFGSSILYACKECLSSQEETATTAYECHKCNAIIIGNPKNCRCEVCNYILRGTRMSSQKNPN